MSLEIKVDDILYCNIDKLWFYFKSSDYFWYFKSQEPFTDRKEVLTIWGVKYNFLVYLSDEGLNWYDKKVGFKIEFRNKYYEVIDIMFNEREKRYLCVFHWKLWRFSSLLDFSFTSEDLIDFITENFTGIGLREIHICLDIEEKVDYLNDIDAYLRKNAPTVTKNDISYDFSSWEFGKHIYMWIESKKDNKEYYYKIYNKTIQAKKAGIDEMYVDYCIDEKNVFRYEIELRQNIAKTINIEDLKIKWNNWKYVINEWICKVFISYFVDKKKFDFVFWKLPVENIKIKRSANIATGSAWKKVNDLKLLPKLKSLRTQAQNIENITGIPIKNNFNKLDEVIWESQDYQYYITLYKWIFRTIQNNYAENQVSNFDELTVIITDATQYTLNFLKVDYTTFFKVIRWWINRNADSVVEFLADNDSSLMEMIYFYYFWRLREWILFDFLDVLKEWNLPVFEKYFKDNKFLHNEIIKKERAINTMEDNKSLSLKDYSTELYKIIYFK